VPPQIDARPIEPGTELANRTRSRRSRPVRLAFDLVVALPSFAWVLLIARRFEARSRSPL
jgi:hypothetical protein